MDERRKPSGTPERRDHSPPGRLRRIHFAYRGGTWLLMGMVALATVLLVATTAWAVNERFKREVARIAYTHDARSLRYLAEQEAAGLAAMSDSVEALESRA